MKFGNKKVFDFQFQFNPRDYRDSHKDVDCDGAWGIRLGINAPYSGTTLGIVLVPAIPYVTCEKCKTAYLAPGFGEFLDKIIAYHLVKSEGALTKKQIKFLRQYLDLNQDELATELGITDKHYLSKMESENHPSIVMSSDKQVRFKLFMAHRLGILEPEVLFRINEQFSEKPVMIDPSIFPPKEEIEQMTKIA